MLGVTLLTNNICGVGSRRRDRHRTDILAGQLRPGASTRPAGKVLFLPVSPARETFSFQPLQTATKTAYGISSKRHLTKRRAKSAPLEVDFAASPTPGGLVTV